MTNLDLNNFVHFMLTTLNLKSQKTIHQDAEKIKLKLSDYNFATGFISYAVKVCTGRTAMHKA